MVRHSGGPAHPRFRPLLQPQLQRHPPHAGGVARLPPLLQLVSKQCGLPSGALRTHPDRPAAHVIKTGPHHTVRRRP